MHICRVSRDNQSIVFHYGVSSDSSEHGVRVFRPMELIRRTWLMIGGWVGEMEKFYEGEGEGEAGIDLGGDLRRVGGSWEI